MERIHTSLLMLRMQKTLTGSTREEKDHITFAKHILAWRWNLTACDLFNVNYRLFSLVRTSVRRAHNHIGLRTDKYHGLI
jgi:hypothetical protein